MCDNGKFRARVDGVEMRPDGMHFTPQSAVVAWKWLAPQITALAA